MMAKEHRRKGDRLLKGWGPTPGTRWEEEAGETWVLIECVVLEGDLLSAPRCPIVLLRNEETGKIARQLFHATPQMSEMFGGPRPSAFHVRYKQIQEAEDDR